MKLAKYTIEVYSLLKDSNFNLFSFDYDFYTDDVNIKTVFETKFKNHYMFNEIGFETVARFKHFLMTRLNEIMPYYKQLYDTEIKSKNIDFLLNKDLTETKTREIQGINDTTSQSNSKDISTSLDQTTNTSNYKESNIGNGNADINLNIGSLTSVTRNEDTSSNSSDVNNTSVADTVAKHINSQTETETFVSKGNIGVTSSAELLEKWRNVIINIDKMIIEECSDLFIQIY